MGVYIRGWCGSNRPVHYSLRRTTDANVEPVSVEDMKLALNVDSTDYDALIASYITAARQMVEQDTGRIFVSQTWTMTLDASPAGRRAIILPIGPVQSVTSITSTDESDVDTVVATTVYRLDNASDPARLVLRDGQYWPYDVRPETALTIVFVAGYATTGDTAEQALLQAVRMLVGHWYANREAIDIGIGNVVTLIPLGYDQIVNNYRAIVV